MATRGIDVSQYQGEINWEVVRQQVDFVIIRCGYGQDQVDQDDTRFKENADACTRLNIPFGVYLYSYALTPEMAIGEANHVLRLVEGYKLAYPVYYDLEDEGTTAKLSNDEIANIARTFSDVMEKNNYYVGIYANLFWWKNILTNRVFERYTKWIASYNNTLNYDGDYGMWQYSDEGRVPGIKGDVDLNFGYEDFPTLIKQLGLNGYERPGPEQYQVGDIVHYNHVFLTSMSQTPLKPYITVGEIVEEVPGARNPYLLEDDIGWLNDQVIERKVEYLAAPDYVGDSFSDALKSISVDNSFENRKRLASLNGISNYTGTMAQNMQLLRLLQKGMLIS